MANPEGMGGAPPTPPDAPDTSTLATGNAAAPGAAPGFVANPPPAEHHNKFVQGIKSLFTGEQTQYQVDPATGKTVATSAKESPGQLFRSLLAGALLGGAAGSQGKSFASGLGLGGTAALERSEQQDDRRRAQAEQQYKNQLEAQKAKREEEGFHSEQEMRKAQIYLLNTQQMVAHQQLAQGDYLMNKEAADSGRAWHDSFVAAGIKPAYDNIPASQIPDLQKKDPNAKNLRWAPVDQRTWRDDKGEMHHELVYAGLDPKSSITVTPGLVDKMREVGMDKYSPGFFDVVKVGKQLDADTAIQLERNFLQLQTEKMIRDKEARENNESAAKIRHEDAEATRAKLEGRKTKLEISKYTQLDDALKDLNKNGGDFDKMTPGNRLILAGSDAIKDAMKSTEDELKDEFRAPTPNEKRIDELQQEMAGYRRLSQQAVKPAKGDQKTPDSPKIPDAIARMNEEGVQSGTTDAYQYIDKLTWPGGPDPKDPTKTLRVPLTPAEKIAALKQAGAVIPWKVVEQRAAQSNQPTSKVVQTLEAEGLKVQPRAEAQYTGGGDLRSPGNFNP